jgi:hypothetical protein
MDRKKAYEQIIAGKLEALPLPDMADAIWSRIETQLDWEMPTDDGGGSGPGAPSGGNWMGRAGLFVFIAAFVTIFLIYKNNKKAEPLVQPEPTVQPAQPPLPAGTNNLINQGRKGEIPLPQNQEVVPATRSGADSASSTPLPVTLAPTDSVHQTTVIPPPFVPIGADTAPPKRKPRGVTGITDDDYRIVPDKKDST